MLDDARINFIKTPEQAIKYAAMLAKEPILGIDIETAPLPQYSELKGAALDPVFSAAPFTASSCTGWAGMCV